MIEPGEEDGTLYAGGDPGVLFESEDGGASWRINQALWQHRIEETWQPGGGGLCVHSIARWPGRPERLAVAVSAAGVWLTEDRGQSWRRGDEGLVPRYLPEDAREGSVPLCVHHIERSPAHPERLFMQSHGGVIARMMPARAGADAGRTSFTVADMLPPVYSLVAGP